MSKRFKITYPNGSNEVIASDAADAEAQANTTFGKTLEELADLGASVEEVGNRTKPEGLQDIPAGDEVVQEVSVSEELPAGDPVLQTSKESDPPKENDNHSDQVAQSPVTHGISGDKGLVEVTSPVGSKTVEAVPVGGTDVVATAGTPAVAQASSAPGPVTLEPVATKPAAKPKKAAAAPTATPPNPWAPQAKEVTRTVEESSKADTK